MCSIPEFQLPNSINEVTAFFNENANGSFIYHGTCQIYHEEICKKGFAGCYSIFKNNELQELVKLLSRLGMSDGIQYNQSPKHRIEKYIFESKSPSLSFTFSAYEAFYYASEIRKGGQIFMAIRDALNWIQWGDFQVNADEKALITTLNGRIKEITKSKGSVYCVAVDTGVLKNLRHYDAVNDVSRMFDAVKYTGKRIPAKKIIGVIHLDVDYIPNHYLIKEYANQIKSNSSKFFNSLVFKLKKERLTGRRK